MTDTQHGQDVQSTYMQSPEIEKMVTDHCMRGDELSWRGKYVAAMVEYRHAANLGSIDASFKMGCIYMYVNPSTVRHKRHGIRWMEKAARRGHLDAALHAGLYYLQGPVVARDASKAVPYFRLACEGEGNAARSHLGMWYVHDFLSVSAIVY